MFCSITKRIVKQDGISIILSVIIVTALVGVVIAAANITRRVTRDNITIQASEIAFLAAESAAEITLYDVIKNGQGVNLPAITNRPHGQVAGAFWDRSVSLAYAVPGSCSVPSPKVVCTASGGPVTNNNPLQVILRDGQSLQFDFNILGAEYPNNIQVLGDGLAQSDIILASRKAQQNISSPSSVLNINDLDGTSDTKVRITNKAGAARVYNITPSGGTAQLPIGLDIVTKGVFGGVERRLEITRPAWLIY